VKSESLVEIINLEKYRLAIGLERPEVVLLIWVVGVAEIVIDGGGFDDASNGFSAKGRDT
jgi:hypothetical protein